MARRARGFQTALRGTGLAEVLTGDAELHRKLEALEKAGRAELVAKAVEAGADILLRQMRALVPKGPTGNLGRSLAKDIEVDRWTGYVNVRVGARKPAGSHAHLVEFGTSERRLKGRGKYPAGTYRGIMPARPFMRTAWESTRAAREQAILEVLRRQFDHAARAA